MLCSGKVFEPICGTFPAVATEVPEIRKRGIQIELCKVEVVKIPAQVMQGVTDLNQTGNLVVLLFGCRWCVPHNRATPRENDQLIRMSAVLRRALFDVAIELHRICQ